MSAGEIPDFNAERYAAGAAPETFMRSYEVDLADKLYQLKVVLENDRPADSTTHAFTFCGRDLENVYLPPSVRRVEVRHGILTSLTVISSHLKGDSHTNLEIHMKFHNARGAVSQLVVKRPRSSTPQPDQRDVVSAQTDREPQPKPYAIDPPSSEQFNRCMGSLVYNNPRIDQSAFDYFDWHGNSYEATVHMLQHKAHTTWSNSEYFLTDLETKQPAVLSYFCKNDDVTEMRLSRTTEQEIYIHDNGHLDSREKAAVFSLSIQKTKVELLEQERTEGQALVTQLCIPTVPDYRAAFDFVDSQINSIRQVQLEQFNDDTTQPLED